MTNVTFESNYAERAGGGFFIAKWDALQSDYDQCASKSSSVDLLDENLQRSTMDCKQLTGNSVGGDG